MKPGKNNFPIHKTTYSQKPFCQHPGERSPSEGIKMIIERAGAWQAARGEDYEK